MKNFEIDNGVINLDYYTALKYICLVVTDQDGKKSLDVTIRIRVDGEYYYARGINECLRLLIQLEVDSYNFMKLFYNAVDKAGDIELTADELYWMEKRDVRS